MVRKKKPSVSENVSQLVNLISELENKGLDAEKITALIKLSESIADAMDLALLADKKSYEAARWEKKGITVDKAKDSIAEMNGLFHMMLLDENISSEVKKQINELFLDLKDEPMPENLDELHAYLNKYINVVAELKNSISKDASTHAHMEKLNAQFDFLYFNVLVEYGAEETAKAREKFIGSIVPENKDIPSTMWTVFKAAEIIGQYSGTLKKEERNEPNILSIKLMKIYSALGSVYLQETQPEKQKQEEKAIKKEEQHLSKEITKKLFPTYDYDELISQVKTALDVKDWGKTFEEGFTGNFNVKELPRNKFNLFSQMATNSIKKYNAIGAFGAYLGKINKKSITPNEIRNFILSHLINIINASIIKGEDSRVAKNLTSLILDYIDKGVLTKTDVDNKLTQLDPNRSNKILRRYLSDAMEAKEAKEAKVTHLP